MSRHASAARRATPPAPGSRDRRRAGARHRAWRPRARQARRGPPEGAVAPVPARRAVRARRDRADRARADRRLRLRPRPAAARLGVALGSLGGLDTAVREHFAGYASHIDRARRGCPRSSPPRCCSSPRRPGSPWSVGAALVVGSPSGASAPRSTARPRVGRRVREIGSRRWPTAQRMQLRGLHHVTAICRDLERDDRVLPRPARARDRHDGPSDDDPQAAPRVVRRARRRARRAR